MPTHLHDPAPEGKHVRNYVVEQGIPIPPRKRDFKYPFDKMEIGDSVLIPAKEARQARDAASAYTGRSGKRFVSRTVDGKGVRIWRVEDKEEKA